VAIDPLRRTAGTSALQTKPQIAANIHYVMSAGGPDLSLAVRLLLWHGFSKQAIRILRTLFSEEAPIVKHNCQPGDATQIQATAALV
jgi:hypothetical protein